MKQAVVISIVLLVGASLAQAQGRGARGGDRRGRQGPASVQASQTADDTGGGRDNVQRPIRQRLRDPNNCQAAEGRLLKQRQRDPANCPRFNAASRGNSPGMGWGGLRRGGGPGGWDRACCPRCGCCRGQGGRHHGWSTSD
jgi:hypothetical protein